MEVSKRKSMINQKEQLNWSKQSSNKTSYINSASAIDHLVSNTMGSSISNTEMHKTLYRERSKINYQHLLEKNHKHLLNINKKKPKQAGDGMHRLAKGRHKMKEQKSLKVKDSLKRSETTDQMSGVTSNNNNNNLNKTKSEELLKGSSSLNPSSTLPKHQSKLPGPIGLNRVDTPSTPINNNETNNTANGGKAAGASAKSINERLNELQNRTTPTNI